jgi:uncharacterized membrane protein (UPF0127 family)
LSRAISQKAGQDAERRGREQLHRKKRVRKVTRNLAPWRLSACLTAHSVLELPAGKADETQTQPGDLLIFEQV